ncbi:MAG TPA: secretin N-terminal domain-containing protein, partial [Myxococcota bacterium]|nr:secretin N-terminal domain-containing protein [Myxococcota bacterium]
MLSSVLLVATLAVPSMPQHRWVAQVPPSSARTSPPPPGAGPGAVVVKPSAAAAGDEDVDYDARKKKGKFSFEFSKAEVVDIVKAISDMTRQNFIIPEKIKGQRITILSPTKISAAEAYQVFHTALSANGISMVRAGRFYKLVDAKDAIKDTVPTCIDDDSGDCALYNEQMVTLLLHMRHVDAAQVNTVAKSLLSKDGDITVFQPSNALIISEYAPNLKRVRRIIDALDVPGFDDTLQLVQIQYSSAAEVAEKLTAVFEVAGPNARPGGAPRPMVPPGMGMPPAGATGGEDSDVQISKIVP